MTTSIENQVHAFLLAIALLKFIGYFVIAYVGSKIVSPPLHGLMRHLTRNW